MLSFRNALDEQYLASAYRIKENGDYPGKLPG